MEVKITLGRKISTGLRQIEHMEKLMNLRGNPEEPGKKLWIICGKPILLKIVNMEGFFRGGNLCERLILNIVDLGEEMTQYLVRALGGERNCALGSPFGRSVRRTG